jgi:hypothetical protein
MVSEWWIALQEQYDEEIEDEAEDERKDEGKDESKAESMINCSRIWTQRIDACTNTCECQWMSMNVNEFQGSSSRDSFTEDQLYVCIEDLLMDGYMKQCQSIHIMRKNYMNYMNYMNCMNCINCINIDKNAYFVPHLFTHSFIHNCSIDTLVHFFIDTLIHWYIDTLIHWYIVILIYWYMNHTLR